jgi:hypothetical protein
MEDRVLLNALKEGGSIRLLGGACRGPTANAQHFAMRGKTPGITSLDRL